MIANNDLFFAFLSKFGFIEVDASCLEIIDQIKLFSTCTHLIGVHGAGMTNMIFNKASNFKIIELFHLNSIPPHYFFLAKQFGFEYYPFVNGNEINGNFLIDIESFSKFMLDVEFLI